MVGIPILEASTERRRSVSERETQLWLKARQAEETLQQALCATQAVAWTWNLSTGRVQRSASARDVYGLKPGSAVGQGFSLVHANDKHAYRRIVKDALRRRIGYSALFRVVRPRDGRMIWLEETARYHPSNESGCKGMLAGLSVDVTERQTAQQRSRLEHSFARALEHSIPTEHAVRGALEVVCEELGWQVAVLWRLDPSAEVLRVCAQWGADAGMVAKLARLNADAECRRGEGLAGLAWARGKCSWIEDLRPYESVPRVAAALKMGLGSAFLCPIPGRRRIIGSLEFLSREPEPMDRRIGETMASLSRLLGEFLERREVEVALTRKRLEQELILNSVPAMIWFKDDRNRILRCNRAAAQWCGRTPSEIEGRMAQDVFHAKAAQYRADDLSVIVSGEPKLGVLERCVSPAGSRCWIRRDLIPYEDVGGRKGVIVFAVDVSPIKKAEAALKRAQILSAENDRQKEFLANVSHEFRTPLAAIKGFAQTLRGRVNAHRDRRRFVGIIERHADRLGALIEDMLTLSALDRQPALTRESVDMEALVRDQVRGLKPVFARKALRLVCALEKGVVKADPLLLRQVLDNLLSNAVKFSRSGGRIWITLSSESRGVRLSVRDEGVGIALEHKSRVFDRFFRVDKGVARGHSGLGLHIVKRIVASHGGRIWLKSTLGRGSTFTLSIPR